uniref:Sepiapterin reductase n=1 Tax=Peronospora matthiolae TaxID=2874970 RepID=A0AAV1UHB4_9STRA
MLKTAVLVTGASRGFGRCLALDFVRLLSDRDLDLHLWARTELDLKDTERMAHAEWSAASASNTLRCFLQAVDLSDPAVYTARVDQVLSTLATETYAQVFLVHNAGSLGQLGLVQESTLSPMAMQPYWELNVTSVMWLNKRFLDVFGATRDQLLDSAAVQTDTEQTQLVVVNITSLCGIEPFKTHMMYCTGKAAREMHHRVIATEQAALDKVRVLQYSPGPMDTEMQQTIRESPVVDSGLRHQFVEMKTRGTLIPPAKSSERGVRLAISGEFDSGAHVDYYDLDSSNEVKIMAGRTQDVARLMTRCSEIVPFKPVRTSWVRLQKDYNSPTSR